MAKVISETDFEFKVALDDYEVVKLKQQAAKCKVRYADFVIEFIKSGFDKMLKYKFGKE